MEMVETNILLADENSANLTVIFEDELSIVKKTVTVQQGVRFAEVSYDIESKVSEPTSSIFGLKFTPQKAT